MSRFKLHINPPNVIAALHDAAMASVSFVLSVYIRLGSEQFSQSFNYLVPGTIGFTLVSLVVFLYMRLYRGLWRYASMRDMIGIVKAVTLSILIFAVLMFTFNRLEGLPRSLLFINWMLLLFLLGAPRFMYRASKDRTFRWSFKEKDKIPVLLIGAGNHAEQFIRDMSRDPNALYDIVALVDEAREQKGRTMHRVPIYGGIDALPAVMRKLERKGQRPQKWIVTDDRISGTTMRHLLELADNTGVPLARLPSLSDFKHGINDRPQIRPIAVEDLLGRAQNVLDRDSMQRFVAGRKVLITGAGGTIGSELTRQIAQFGPSELILIEFSEFNLYYIEREIRERFPELPLTVLLANIGDMHHIDVIFSQYLPNLVFHAAAIKHVPMAEKNVEQAILTNVFGTCHIAQACQKYRVDVMVMISTDKAVNPGNVMGASKRLAESYCQSLGSIEHSEKSTKYFTVRFGNVLGSTGSVVPLFQEQLAKGGPLTVTHPDMVRYFMTVREAVELVLQAAVLGDAMSDRQECIFVLDMGQPVRILDLATQMIKLAGLKPDEDIKITYTGLRPGEKLFEELFHFSENAVKTTHDGIFLASPRVADMAALRKGLEKLYQLCTERKTADALAQLKHMVPEFKSLFKPGEIR